LDACVQVVALFLDASFAKANPMPTVTRWDEARRLLAAESSADLLLEEQVALGPRTTLKIGGPARLLARCRTAAGVSAAIRAAGQVGCPWLVLGLGANVLVPDTGLDAMVVTLEGDLGAVERDGTAVRAGGGASLAKLVREAVDAGLAGVECLSGIPSTVGGALAMNAGAWGQEILDVLAWAEVVEADGALRRLERWEVDGGYRWSVLGRGRVVTRAEFQLRAESSEALKVRLREVRDKRLAALPPEPSAGSVFRNPSGDYAGRLLELAGCKGLRAGGAEVSQRHANVIVNPGGATALEVRALVAEMARRVQERFAVELELELKVLSSAGEVIADPQASLA